MNTQGNKKRLALRALQAMAALAAALLLGLWAGCEADSGSEDPDIPDTPGSGTTTCTVTFAPGEGASVDPGSKEYTQNRPAADLPVPVKPGHTFVDWYDKDGGTSALTSDWGNRFTSKTIVRKNITVYARWVEDDPIPFPLANVSRDTLKLNKNGKPVINVMWGEPEEDPRIVMGYQLEDSGQLFFDRYVCLYGGRIVDWDCGVHGYTIFGSTNPTTCAKTGLHLHIDDNVKGVMEKHQTYYKPLQDKGIKVLMGIVPQNGGVAVGTLYNWPMEDVKPWGEIYPTAPMGPGYRFGPEAADKFAEEVIALVKEYQLDGVAYDEEYGNLKGATGYGRGNVVPNVQGLYYTENAKIAAAWKRGGENLLRFAHRLKQLNPAIIQESYEIKYGAHIPPEMTIDGETVKMLDIFDITYAVYYNQWAPKPNCEGVPNNRYGPAALDIASGQASGPRPSLANLRNFMNDHIAANYGVNMFYCLRSRAEMEATKQNFYGQGITQPDTYLSTVSSIIYGENVIYTGDDYARLW